MKKRHNNSSEQSKARRGEQSGDITTLCWPPQTNNAKEYLIAQTKEPKTTKHKNTWEIYNAKKGMG